MSAIDAAYRYLFTGGLLALAITVVLCLAKAILGPRTADRIVSVNMIGTQVTTAIAALAVMLGEGYLIDICIIYALLSFIAVIVLTKVYMGAYAEKQRLKAGRPGK